MHDGRQRGHDITAYLFVALAALFWSGNHVIGRAVAGHVPPIAMSTLRWIVPALLLAPFAAPHLRRDWPLIRAHFGLIAFLSLSNGAVFGTLQYIGLQYTTAINTSVLNSVAPVLIVLAGMLLFGDRTSLRQMGGILVSLIGVIVIVAKGDLAILAGFAFNWGDLIILFNMGIFAVYSAYLRLRPKIHWLSFTFALAVISSLAMIPVWALEHGSGTRLQATWMTAATLAYVTIFPSVGALVCWNRGVEMIGPGRAGAILHVMALYSAVLASVFLGEALRLFHLAGFALILGGVWMAARKA
jgi:drug/metabolite transporter (DMT)-like permease